MAKKAETPGEAQPPVVVDRATRVEALKLRAAELPWDPEDLRLFLLDLVELI